MYNTFNMGIGFVLCIDSSDEFNVIKALENQGLRAYKMGTVEKGGAGVCIK